MDNETIQRLNNINREFYRITAAEFDATRGTAWRGWERLLPHLKMPLSVLDVGCGNGRFGLFLAQNKAFHEKPAFNYHGIDSSPALLERARETLASLPSLNVMLEERDIVNNPPDTGEYDLVVLFGVMHHVPGHQQRQDLLRTLAQRVASGGILVFACWRFLESDTLRERIVAWDDDLKRRVEHNDYLLDWRRGEPALRYCHYVNDAEHAALIAATGLTLVETYRADGHNDTMNLYTVLRR